MPKPKGHIILKICDDGIYYNSVDKLDWDTTNFPDKKFFGITKSRDIYWLAKMIEYRKVTGDLIVEIVDFGFEYVSDFENQQPKAQVNFILFENLLWSKLKEIFSFYKQQHFKEIEGSFLAPEAPTDYELDNLENYEVDLSKLDLKPLKFSFQQSLSKITFKMGYVETIRNLKGVSKKALVKIYNPHIIPEFEFVKPYFAKYFGTRKISIFGVIGNKNDASTYQFRSPHISSINEDFITNIKRLEISRKIRKPKIVAVDKSLFTPEEFFDGFEADKGNNIRKSDQELLKDILEARGVRNAKQLLYISGSLQSPNDRIHFTLTPQFGFLFYVAGEEMHHYIWELLDSHATYLWSADKDQSKSDLLKIVTHKINYIRDHGRTHYLGHEDHKEVVFSRINHEHADSKLVDGFPKWRKRLEEKLV